MTQRMSRSVLALLSVALLILIFVVRRTRTQDTTKAERVPAGAVTPTAQPNDTERPLEGDFKAAMQQETSALNADASVR